MMLRTSINIQMVVPCEMTVERYLRICLWFYQSHIHLIRNSDDTTHKRRYHRDL